MNIVLTNQSSNAQLTPLLSNIAEGLQAQLREDVAPAWGLAPTDTVSVDTTGKVKPGDIPGTIVCTFVDELPEAPGALGYHDEDEKGNVYMRIGVSTITENGGALISGALSASGCASHEAIETIGDENANMWCDRADGKDEAREWCDRVEDGFYMKNGVAVSNFLLPAAFDSHKKTTTDLPDSSEADAAKKVTPKYDFLGALKTQDGLTPGGYVILRTEPGAVSQQEGKRAHYEFAPKNGRAVVLEFGESYPTWKMPGKIHKAQKRRAA